MTTIEKKNNIKQKNNRKIPYLSLMIFIIIFTVSAICLVIFAAKKDRDNPFVCKQEFVVDSIISVKETRGKNSRTYVEFKLSNEQIVTLPNISIKKGDMYCTRIERKYPE
jgi:ABC-type microcin C transport system permease subunit YejE